MRLALGGCLAAGSLFTSSRLLLPNLVFIWLLALLAFVAFTLLWLLHIFAFTVRVVLVKRELQRDPDWGTLQEFGLLPDTRLLLLVPLAIAMAVVKFSLIPLGVLALAVVRDTVNPVVGFGGIRLGPASTCGCYFPQDCKGPLPQPHPTPTPLEVIDPNLTPDPGSTSTGSYQCNWDSGCAKSGKNDGECTFKNKEASWSSASPTDVGLAIDAYFTAYEERIVAAGGRPQAHLLRKALAVPLPMAWHLEILTCVHNSLDVAIGHDFDHPPLGFPMFFGNIQAVPGVEKGLPLVQAIHRAFVEAVGKNDRGVIQRALKEYWKKQSKYRPIHAGRCYPHGHPEVADVKSSRDCITTGMQQILDYILAGRT